VTVEECAARRDEISSSAVPILKGQCIDFATPSVIRSTVVELNLLCKASTLQFALAVGALVIKRLYSGEVKQFRSRDRKRDISLRRVANHSDLAMSPSMLYGCVAIYELCERIGIQSWKHVSTSHLRLVLPLQPADQERLLRIAEDDRWPVRRLEEEVAAVRRISPPGMSRGGRKRDSLRTAIHVLQRNLDAMLNVLEIEASAPESKRPGLDVLRRALETCGAVEKRLVRMEAEAIRRRSTGPSNGTHPPSPATTDDACAN
jgi:hypothetical protein